MEMIKKQYIINEKNERVAVVLDLKTFEKIENLLEDFGLAKLMEETLEKSHSLNLEASRVYYSKLPKTH